MSVRILSPIPSNRARAGRALPPLRTLKGRVLGFRVEWSNFEVFVDHIEQDLRRSGEIAAFKRWDLIMDKRVLGRANDEDKIRRQQEFEEFAAGLDAAVVGLAA
jgi:hypothetical protein